MRLRIKFEGIKINKVIRYFLGVDMLFLGGWGLIGPIFAVFILDQIDGATVFTIGAVSALYWITKSISQIPISMYLDKHAGERDDFYALVFALALAGFSAMAFLLVKTIAGLFVVQFLHALAMAFYTPSWSGMYSRHLDKDHTSFNWTMDSTLIGLSHAFTALIGGGIAVALGFKAVFILVSILSFAGAFLLFSVPHLIFPKVTGDPNKMPLRDHASVNTGK